MLRNYLLLITVLSLENKYIPCEQHLRVVVSWWWLLSLLARLCTCAGMCSLGWDRVMHGLGRMCACSSAPAYYLKADPCCLFFQG